MKTAARIILSATVAAVVHFSVFEAIFILSCGIGWLFLGTSLGTWYFRVSGGVLCYLPALLTGIILNRVKGSFRPGITAPLGVMAFWALFLGYGAIASGPYVYWTGDQGSIVPWLFNDWTLAHCLPGLCVLLSTGLTARLGVEWLQPQQEAKWLLVMLVIFNVVVGLAAIRYFFLPYIDHDEAEQSHVIWALSQGVIPYRDIHQIHMPLLWMLLWPIMNWVPWTFATLLSLRITCALALVGSYLAGLLMLREILGHINRVHALILLLLVLSVVPDFQFHTFRTDPFMTMCSAWAILAAVRMQRSPARYSLLCGVAFGLAASFSIRLSWLCFLVPLVSLWECGRQRTLRPLWLVIPNGAGFVLGILPVAIWIAYHGVFQSFWSWVVVGNAGSIYNASGFQLLDMLFMKRFFTVLALLGGFSLLWTHWRMPKQAWAPSQAILVGALLAWSVPVTNSLHLIIGNIHFAYQVIMIPGAVLGTVFVAKVLAWKGQAWQLRLAAVALVFVFIQAQEPTADQSGYPLTKMGFQDFSRLCSSKNATCVCLTPWHPIFCRDAADLYLGWDEGIARNPTFSAQMRKKHQQLWPPAVAVIEKGTPDLISAGMFDLAHGDGLIDDEQYERYQRAVQSLYESTDVDGRRVYTLKKDRILYGKSP